MNRGLRKLLAKIFPPRSQRQPPTPNPAMTPRKIRLFIKPFCGWCREATEWLDKRGIPYETLNVSTNAAARQEMFALTGQRKAPCIEVDGEVLADFGADELAEWWRQNKFD